MSLLLITTHDGCMVSGGDLVKIGYKEKPVWGLVPVGRGRI
jgi:hypothetical protein